jgi:metallo-beta-lactamase class B
MPNPQTKLAQSLIHRGMAPWAMLALGIFGVLQTAFGQADETSRSWNKPVPPFRIFRNFYYVGASEVTSFLITTDQGHILLDGGFVKTAASSSPM